MLFKNGLCTAQALSPGNLDKLADTIADTVVDGCLGYDPSAIIEVGAKITGDQVVVAGEYLSREDGIQEKLDNTILSGMIDEVLLKAGYKSSYTGIDVRKLKYTFRLRQGQVELNPNAFPHGMRSFGQVQVYGYASAETKELLPAPLVFARRLMANYHQMVTHSRRSPLHPDARARVGFRYEDGEPIALESISLECQHSKRLSPKERDELILRDVIGPALPEELCSEKLRVDINPSGPIFIEEFRKDIGASGRQDVSDTYGGAVPMSSHSLVGKGPFALERAGSYMARFLANQVVARGWAKRCLIRMEFLAGSIEPYDFQVESEENNRQRNLEIAAALRREFDLHLFSMIHLLELTRPLYRHISAFGHFGRNPRRFYWEIIKEKVPAPQPPLFTHHTPQLRQPLPEKLDPKQQVPPHLSRLYPYVILEDPEGASPLLIEVESGAPEVEILPQAYLRHPQPYGDDGLLSEESLELLFEGLKAAAEVAGYPILLVVQEFHHTRFLPDGQVIARGQKDFDVARASAGISGGEDSESEGVGEFETREGETEREGDEGSEEGAFVGLKGKHRFH